ncbi:ubiquitin carboxyl-terminal hydrolase 18-like [Chenopodium quinoa]|uniref:Uncharacterized protein n=1 Tax=Chenopodium quinoa TaxID=63459 RepID=A0A803LXU6_CHEQI|nr:ubiquitin carboxyl-terminal hydrolase 18-like [Chenopodium quinoa]
MHVSSFTQTLSLDPNPNPNPNPFWNWNWVLQFFITVFFLALGFLCLLRSTASKYFVVDSNFNSNSNSSTTSFPDMDASVVNSCASCGKPASKVCTGCKLVRYCSAMCQKQHWLSEHRKKCSKSSQQTGGKRNMSIALVPSSGSVKTQKVVDKVLFPYDEFVKLYDWDKSIFPPCGLLNCGNSCFANVVLQCLAHTRPLVAYLLEKGHRRNCRRNEWCFLCELEMHMTKASRSQQPFSPINILSRLPSIGGNLGHGKQEDAHEFMRFAIDTMQSVCLDEHGGEKVIDPKSQETTLIQHIFGGQLRSQVICTTCNQVSYQYENMMDLTVEIQGDATSLQECLDQFTAKEWLHGENLYKCDGCNDYVRAWKRLTIHQAPNVLTIALKRFQSGRFGKINKKIIFPESLDLSPYMSEGRDGTDKYKLYAVVVHVDMLNASFFGHYICYTKGFQGDWYRIDDCKVARVELDEVLSQGAYMLLYRRISARPKCLKTSEPAINQQQDGRKLSTEAENSSSTRQADSLNSLEVSNSNCSSANHLDSDVNRQLDHTHTPAEQLKPIDSDLEDFQTVNSVSDLPVSVEVSENGNCSLSTLTAVAAQTVSSSPSCSSAELPGEVSDIPGSSAMGGNLLSEASREGLAALAVAAASVSDVEAVCFPADFSGSTGKPEEHRFEDENNSHVAGISENFVPVTSDPTVPCEMNCYSNGSVAGYPHHKVDERMDSEMGYLGLLDKEESEVSPDGMDLDSVELNEPDNRSNGNIHDITTDESPVNSC